MLLVGGFILAIGYGLACIAAGLALARVIGGPLAFAGLAVLHLIVGAIALALIDAPDEARAAHAGDQARGQPQHDALGAATCSEVALAMAVPLRKRVRHPDDTEVDTELEPKTTRAGRSRSPRWPARRPRSNDRASASSAR